MHKHYPAWARLPISTVCIRRWKRAMAMCYRTTDTARYDKEQTSRNTRRFHANRSIMHLALAVAMVRGTLLRAHSPTVLTNPEPQVFLLIAINNIILANRGDILNVTDLATSIRVQWPLSFRSVNALIIIITIL